MIKIIKEGKPKIYARRFECRSCGCVFLADQSEYAAIWDYTTFVPGIQYVCVCPCCGRNVYAKSEEEVVDDL